MRRHSRRRLILTVNKIVEELARSHAGPFSVRDLIGPLSEVMPGYNRTYYRAKIHGAMSRMEADGNAKSILVSGPNTSAMRLWEVVQ